MIAIDDVRLLNIDNNNPIKDNTTKIKNYAKDVDADIIISNWHQASFSGAKMLDSEVPIMFINHGHHGLGSILSLMKNIMNKNHSCYMVSKYQHEWYRAMSKRMNADDAQIGLICIRRGFRAILDERISFRNFESLPDRTFRETVRRAQGLSIALLKNADLALFNHRKKARRAGVPKAS